LLSEKVELQEELAECKVELENKVSAYIGLQSDLRDTRQEVSTNEESEPSEIPEEAQKWPIGRRIAFERALKQAEEEAAAVGGSIDVHEFAREWDEKEGLVHDLQGELVEQLGGALGESGRLRRENSEKHAEYLEAAALYVIWKARYALEQTIRKEREVEIEALHMKYNPEELDRVRSTYDSLQMLAYTRDFRDLFGANFVGVTGKDAFNVPVMVFAAAHVPREISFERWMQFVVYMLDDLVDNPYHIVYVNSQDGDMAPPEIHSEWIEKALEILPAKYRKNLLNLFVLHPTFWFKMSNFPVDSATQKKLVFVDTIDDLFEHLGRRGTILPGYAYASEGRLHDSRKLLSKVKKQSWNTEMAKVEDEAKQRLLTRDQNALDFLAYEKQRLIREELYADAELVKDEMETLRSEVSSLEMELGIQHQME